MSARSTAARCAGDGVPPADASRDDQPRPAGNPADDHARQAYDTFAAHYDDFTAHHDYDDWTATLERLAGSCGLRGRRLLDVACGTGKSFLPFLERGYQVTACDVSAQMVRLAAQKARGRARVEVHDMRRLPRLGTFDLICCLDDAVNYLLTTEELSDALLGLRENLAPDGVIVFDVNTLRSYRTFFASPTVIPGEDRVLIWDGQASTEIGVGDLAKSTLEAFERSGDGWQRQRSVHHQRHHPRPVVLSALCAAGLKCAGEFGMRPDGSVTDGFAELKNSKAVYIARHRAHEGKRR